MQGHKNNPPKSTMSDWFLGPTSTTKNVPSLPPAKNSPSISSAACEVAIFYIPLLDWMCNFSERDRREPIFRLDESVWVYVPPYCRAYASMINLSTCQRNAILQVGRIRLRNSLRRQRVQAYWAGSRLTCRALVRHLSRLRKNRCRVRVKVWIYIICLQDVI